uniref:GNAT family N-acetyltransferase n=1 Tax=Ningiella ruwaisensis TaxID=2364274 RepID=UPI0010A076B0|nr:GNAT family N-acetyltransferase [Ningiella ruwaisensis]
MSQFKYLCIPFNELTNSQLYQILALRSEVFVVEQACIYQDIDEKDRQAGVHHLLLLKKDKLIGYARLLPPKISYPDPSIGRIVIAPGARGEGLGKLLIKASINHTQKLWPALPITIGAQSHLSLLYQSFGFKEISPHYDEDGIMHVDMQLAPVN